MRANAHTVRAEKVYEEPASTLAFVFSSRYAAIWNARSSSDKESAIESALEKRSVAPKSGNKRKNGNRERNKYKSHEEMLFFDDKMY